jgi:hypothetical protein
MRKLLGPLLMATLLAAPASAEPSFVGIWYSGTQPDEPGVLSLMEFRADGTFREEFRKCQDGTVVGFDTAQVLIRRADGTVCELCTYAAELSGLPALLITSPRVSPTLTGSPVPVGAGFEVIRCAAGEDHTQRDILARVSD